MSNKSCNSGQLKSDIHPNRPNQHSRPGIHQGNPHSYNNLYANVVYNLCQQNIAFALSEKPVTLAHPPSVPHPAGNLLIDIHKSHSCTVPSPLAAKKKTDKAKGSSK